jgi:hypothetical protein
MLAREEAQRSAEYPIPGALERDVGFRSMTSYTPRKSQRSLSSKLQGFRSLALPSIGVVLALHVLIT